MKYILRLILPIYIIFLVASAFSEGKDTKKSDNSPGAGEFRLSIKISKEIDDRMPVDIDSIFENAIGRVYCWSMISRSKSDVDTIYHIWNYEGKEESRVPIEITSPTFRAITPQAISPDQVGEWTVYIVDKQNNILGKSKFKIESPQPEIST